MELHACGFNAVNQLAFKRSMCEDEPDDIFLFKKVLCAREISHVRASLCYTIRTLSPPFVYLNGATLTNRSPSRWRSLYGSSMHGLHGRPEE